MSYNHFLMSQTLRKPLRKVVRTYSDNGITFDELECGHRWSWSGGKGEFFGTWPAKRRRCSLCPDKAPAARR